MLARTSPVATALLVATLAACSEPAADDLGGASDSGPPSSSVGATDSGRRGGADGSTSGADSGTTKVFLGDEKEGIATYYDATGDGSCSFGASADLDVAAFNLPEFAKSASCGSCVKVNGPKGTVTVRIVDSCPGCEAHHIDLSRSAFGKIAELEAGRVAITYQTVACAVTGNMTYQFKDGSHEFWTAIQIRNHKIPIETVEAKRAGTYRTMTRSTYNYFIEAGGLKDDPIELRITAVDGQVVHDSIPGAKGRGGHELSGHVQFE